MSLIRNINIEKLGEPDHPDMIYYNLDIINGKTYDEGEGTSPNIRYNETRDTPLIKDTSKYFFSIVRFTMNGADKEMPLFLPSIRLGQNNPNMTVYHLSVELDYGGTKYLVKSPIIWQPQHKSSQVPPAPQEKQFINNKYYFCYTYEHWLKCINDTLQVIMDELEAKSVQTLGNSPYFVYDKNSNRFKIYAPSDRWLNTASNTGGKLRLFFDSNMYGLFSYFNHNYIGGDDGSKNSLYANPAPVYDNGSGGYRVWPLGGLPSITGTNNLLDYMAYELIFNDPLELNKTTINSVDYTILEQDFKSTSSLWSPVSSIVFVSTLIPIVNEQIGEPVKFRQGNVGSSNGVASNFTPIITDIALANDYAHSYNEFLSYVPSAEYRLSSLSNSKQEVRNIDVSVYWKNRLNGELLPISMFNLSSISIKIMFRRREFNLGRY